MRVQTAAREIAQSGLAESAHDLSDGGLAVALAESSFGPAGIGADIDLDSDLRPELLLFHEGPSRVLISTAEPERIIKIGAKHAVEAIEIGSTVKDRIVITNKRKPLIQGDIGTFKHGWETALEIYVR
jgi:phosphoribosylformylglycinamidine synthase